MNDCRAEITSLKMHIEGTRSSKRLSSGDTDGLIPANSMEEIVVLSSEHDNLKGSESITSKLASEVSLADGKKKDHENMENSLEGSPGPEAEVSCSTAENSGYGTSGEDKSGTNTCFEDLSVNGNLHGSGNSQGDSDSISVYLTDDKVHTEKVESPYKQKSSDKMVSDLIYIRSV